MAFNLPSAQYLMTTNGSNNRGTFRTAPTYGLKNGGNLPITTSGTQCANASGERGVYFGLNSQTSTSGVNASTNTKVLLTSVQFNAPNRIQVNTIGNRGIVARLTSGNGGGTYREFNIGGNDTPFGSSQAGPVTICIDLSATSNNSSNGSFNTSNITGWGYGTRYLSLVGGSSNLNFFQRVFLFDTNKGGANLPTFTGSSSFDDAVSAVQGSSYTNKIGAWCTKSGSAVFLPCPFSFGNGSNAVSFNDNGASVISPADNASNQENFRLTNQAMRVYLDTRNNSSDTVVLSGSYAWGTASPWNFNVSNNSTCTLSGSFNGMGTFTLGSSVTATGSFNLASGSSVISNGATIDDITVTGDLTIQGSSITTFDGLTVGGTLTFDTAGTYTITNSTIQEVANTSGGSVTIVLGSNSTINVNSGPNITISSVPSVLTLTGLQPNSEVRVFTAGTTTELAGVENSGTSFVANINVSSVDIVIHSVGYEYQKIENADTSSNLTLPVQQRFDRNYRNP